MKPHGILWQGPSPIDGSPLLAIATLATPSKANTKTGPMVQVYILRADMSPLDAVATGQDSAICGACPMRGDGHHARACYVAVGKGPQSVWLAHQRGNYVEIGPRTFHGHTVRWGAYGDPACLPVELVRQCNSRADGWTGYTHQWMRPWAQDFRHTFMASVETRASERKARGMGWGTFRAGLPDGSDRGRTRLCASERDGTQCQTCLECSGQGSIYIPGHGAGAKFVPAARLLRVLS